MSKHKRILIGIEARDEVIKGANYLASAVKPTLGPFGSNALLEKKNRITNDGVSIAREISLKDEIQNRGLTVLREAAIKTNDIAGDGTTTAIILAQAILEQAVQNLPTEAVIKGKMNPPEMIRKIEEERKEVEAKLIEMKEEITSKEQLISSARVSVEDDELAEFIGSTQWDLGKEGVILVEETAALKNSIEKVSGIRIDNGFGTSLAINNQEKQSLELENVAVLYTNNTISSLIPIKVLLDRFLEKQKNSNLETRLVIIARAFTQRAIGDCELNAKSGFHIFPINAPYVNQVEIMKDLEAVLGGKFINADENKIDTTTLEAIGFATKIVAKRFDAIFTGQESEESKKKIELRVDELKKALTGEVSDFEKKMLESRISQLTSGFGLLKIGATSEVERRYKKDKADDAVNAVKAALEEGVVPGAGLAFKQISDSLPDSYILKRPLRTIHDQIIFSSPPGFKVEDWVKDPVKVLRVALEKACSVASVLASITLVEAVENDPVRYMVESSEAIQGEADQLNLEI